jgi:autoinducer 2-degrading protein
MYVIFNRIKVKSEHLEDFLKNVKIHAQNSNNEPGCVRYEVLQEMTDPQLVFLIEVFENEDAFHIHRTYDFYKEWMEKSRDWRHSEERIRHVMDYIYREEDV